MIRTVSYQYPVSTPPYIPDPEVYQEWMDAVCRPDGMTLALVKARQRLSCPVDDEAGNSRGVYGDLAKRLNYPIDTLSPVVK